MATCRTYRWRGSGPAGMWHRWSFARSSHHCWGNNTVLSSVLGGSEGCCGPTRSPVFYPAGRHLKSRRVQQHFKRPPDDDVPWMHRFNRNTDSFASVWGRLFIQPAITDHYWYKPCTSTFLLIWRAFQQRVAYLQVKQLQRNITSHLHLLLALFLVHLYQLLRELSGPLAAKCSTILIS